MRLLFAGTPAIAVPSLHALVAAGHEIVAVATNPDAPGGRGRALTASPVALAAEEMGVVKLQPERARDEWFGEAVQRLDLDAAVIVAWGTLIPQSLLSVPKHGWVNLHFSLLPAWRGAAPVQRAIMAGCDTTGVTTFRLVREMDAGPVWRRDAVPIGPGETAGQLLERLAVFGAGTLVSTLGDIERGARPIEQVSEGVTLAPKVTSQDARIDWSRPARQVYNLVRGVTPAPGAWTMLGDVRLKVASVAVAEGELAPGELVVERQRVLAGAGDGAVELLTVQAPGKPPMAGADWARGARLGQGARFD